MAKKRTPSTRAHRRGRAKLPVYTGPFQREHAERLLWRAGFGPAPGQADQLAAKGMRDAVLSLTRPQGKPDLQGQGPSDGKGNPLAPIDMWGHDHLWWLDRMVRTDQPLVERMTLIWHDWWATSRAGAEARWMMRQNDTLRRHALGSFKDLALDVTRDPAMLQWLSGAANNKWSPNENYARELMELFTLGAGRGYTERDVREQARALTGFRNDWHPNLGAVKFRYDKTFHDDSVKHVFGRRGRYDWRDAVMMCLRHPKHPSFMVSKLWNYFIPTKLSRSDDMALQRLYTRSGYEIRPLVEAILMHPAFYTGPRMIKPPVVHVAGMLRHLRRPVDTEAWIWICDMSGQRLFLPPNVSGWDETRWLDTSTWRGRWYAANEVLSRSEVKDPYPFALPEAPEDAVARALEFWGTPAISAQTQARLLAFARDCDTLANTKWKKAQYPKVRMNALRILIASSPDYMTC